jgi:hypothetical integral membrane protein (TIGR02206 family)
LQDRESPFGPGALETLMSTTDPFGLFGPAHLITLLIIAVAAVVLPFLARRTLGTSAQYRLGSLIAFLLIGQEGFHIWLLAMHYDQAVGSLLPLHLCGLSVVLTAWVLAARSYPAYEIVYFWAWGGTLQALATPDLSVGFPDPAFIAFFIGHGLVIVGVLYATLVYRFRPRLISIFKSLGALMIAVAIVAPINVWLGTNYLFLCSKPSQTSLMDHLGPWPWYILSLAGLALVSSVVYYLPFLIKDLLSGEPVSRRSGPPGSQA